MLGFILVAVAFVVLVRMPATATGRFVLRPESGAEPMNAPWDAVVAQIRVRLGSRVEEGDVLIVLRAEGLRQLAAERAQLRAELSSEEEYLAALSRADGVPVGPDEPAELRARIEALSAELGAELELQGELERRHLARERAARGQLASRRREVSDRRAHVATLDSLVETYQAALAEGVASRRELLQQRAEVESARVDLEAAVGESAAAESALAALEGDRAVEVRERELAARRLSGELGEARAALSERVLELEASIAAGRQRLDSLDAALAAATGDRLEIRAPYAGSVVALEAEQEGVAVARGEVLCELARGDSPLLARLSLPESEAARVQEGQRVRLLLDAYPHTRHGVKVATLDWVSAAAHEGELIALARLEDEVIRVDGRPVRLRAGLEGEARVRTGSRSLLEYVLEPLRQIRESVAPDDRGSSRAAAGEPDDRRP
jgi:multidrug resistance efflux pump